MLPLLLTPSRKRGTAKHTAGDTALWLLQTSSPPTITISPLCTSRTSFCVQVNIREVMLPPARPRVESWANWNGQGNTFPLEISSFPASFATWGNHVIQFWPIEWKETLRVGFWEDLSMREENLGPFLLFPVLKANVMSGTKADILRPCSNMHKHKKPTCSGW